MKQHFADEKNGNPLHLAGRFLSARPCIAHRRTTTNRHMGATTFATHQAKSKDARHQFANKWQVKQLPC